MVLESATGELKYHRRRQPSKQLSALHRLSSHALGRDRARRRQAIDLLRLLRRQSLPEELALSIDTILFIIEQRQRDRSSEMGIQRSDRGEIVTARLICTETPLLYFARRPESLQTLKAMTIRGLYDEEDLAILRHCPQLQSLEVHDATLDDSEIAEINCLSNLTRAARIRCCRLINIRSASRKPGPAIATTVAA